MLAVDSNPEYIHFFGLRRSGNHAVINWLVEGWSETGKVTHFNSVAGFRLPEREPAAMRTRINDAQPTAVIMSYEDVSFERRHSLEHYREFRSSAQKDILLLRSFPNMMASRIQRVANLEREGISRSINRLGWVAVRDLWRENALNMLALDGSQEVGVRYDEWFVSRAYRDEMARSLGFINSDAGINDVPANAQGSSYDRTSYHGRGQEMNVLHRWRSMVADKSSLNLYRSLVTEEIIDLNRRLFGPDQPTIV